MSFLLLVLFVCGLSAEDITTKPPPPKIMFRIVNGTDTAPGEIPYIVSLREVNSHVCGASILDEFHVLTAAHCVNDNARKPSVFSVQYGVARITNDTSQTIVVDKLWVHPDFMINNTAFNDIAVLKLKDKMVFGANAQPVKLPEQGAPTPGDQWALLSGWGYPFTNGQVMDILQHVSIQIYTDQACDAVDIGTSPKCNLCAGVQEGGKGQCSGDSGGPLAINGVQHGVVSWSVKPCGIKGFPGVFTKVSTFVDWIKNLMMC